MVYWLIRALGKRFKDSMAYLVALSYIITHVAALLVVSETIVIEEDDSDASMPGLGMLSKICSAFGIYTLLLAPTIWHVTLVYVPGFIICIIHFIHRHDEFENLFILVALYMVIVLITAWYIF